MGAYCRWRRFASGVVLTYLVSSGSALLADPPPGHGPPSTTPGQTHKPQPFTPPGHQSAPPSDSPLPPPSVVGANTVGTTPFAWIDDANLLPAGTAVFMVSGSSWQGADASEWDVPVTGAAVGLAPRVQIAASVPHVIGNDASGITGGLGTSFVTMKLGVIQRNEFKLAVSPTLEVLGEGVLQFLVAGERRVDVGVPVSVEFDHGNGRAFASAGYFTQGIRFVGGGVGLIALSRVSASASFSHAWLSAASFAVGAATTSVRDELSGTVSVTATRHVGVFGSVGHTVATSDANGAGFTIGGGVWLLAVPPPK